MAEVIIDGEVLNAAVVPHRQRTLLPSHSTGEVNTATVLEEEVEDCRSFRMVKFLDSNGVDLINKK